MQLRSLSRWALQLREAANFFSHWLARHLSAAAGGEERLPVLHLPSFSFPTALLSAVLQQYTRKHSTPIDSLMVVPELTGRRDRPPPDSADRVEDGVYLEGLWMESASWERGSYLSECRPGEIWCDLPLVVVQAVPQSWAYQQVRPAATPSRAAPPSLVCVSLRPRSSVPRSRPRRRAPPRCGPVARLGTGCDVGFSWWFWGFRVSGF